MNRADLQRLSRMRQLEAQVLLNAGHFAGAYYLLGYAVECALKARLCKKVKHHDFPDRDLALKSFTHDLQALINTAELKTELDAEIKANPQFRLNWGVVAEWSESSRYATSITEVEARGLHVACTDRKNGILRWIKKRW